MFIVGSVGYLFFNLRRELDNDLAAHVEDIEQVLSFGPDDQLQVGQIATGADPDRTQELYLEIRGLDGSILYRNHQLADGHLGGMPLPDEGKYSYSPRSATFPNGERIRLASRVDFVEVHPVLIRLGTSEQPLWRDFKRSTSALLAALPVALLIAGFVAFALAKRSLAPIGAVEMRAEQITAESLIERLPVENPEDELGHLVRVFNNTLARLESSFERLRRFTADASHELRTPLTAIRSVGEVGLQQDGDVRHYREIKKDLVEERSWISRQDYFEGLAFSQISPRPLAAQLAMYLGWVRAGRFGAAVVSATFVIPSFVMAVALAAAYVFFGQLAWIQETFYGIGAAVIAIIAQSAYRLARKTIGKDRFLLLFFVVVAIATVWTLAEIIWLFVLCGLMSLVVQAKPAFLSKAFVPSIVANVGWFVSGMNGTASSGLLWTLFFFFAKAGALVFGSGLAFVPFLYGGVVSRFHWLSERQFLDAIAVAMITPGPVVITAAFIGYLVGGLIGGAAAAIAVFAPPFLIVIVAAPYYRRFAGNRQVKAFVQGVTAAAVGAIAAAAVILARPALVDTTTVVIAVATFTALRWAKRVPEPVLILMAGLAGLPLRQGFGHAV
jgi:chromate transporter